MFPSLLVVFGVLLLTVIFVMLADLLFPVFCSRHPALSILLTLLLSLFLVIVLFLLQVIMTGAIFG